MLPLVFRTRKPLPITTRWVSSRGTTTLRLLQKERRSRLSRYQQFFPFAGTLDLPQRSPNAADARLSPFPEPETASPDKPTISRRDGVRAERIDRIGLELGAQDNTQYHVEENDPLSAVAELRHTQTLSRNEWQIRLETQLRLSSTGNTFLLQGSLRAMEGANEVCRRSSTKS
jgi:hypothetical protein